MYTNSLCIYALYTSRSVLQVQRFSQNLFSEFRLYNLIQMQMIYLLTYKAPMSIFLYINRKCIKWKSHGIEYGYMDEIRVHVLICFSIKVTTRHNYFRLVWKWQLFILFYKLFIISLKRFIKFINSDKSTILEPLAFMPFIF